LFFQWIQSFKPSYYPLVVYVKTAKLVVKIGTGAPVTVGDMAALTHSFERDIYTSVYCICRRRAYSVLRSSFKSTDYTNAKKVIHGDLRGDRPPHGRPCIQGRTGTTSLFNCSLAFHGSRSYT